jgi:hypothetical protein
VNQQHPELLQTAAGVDSSSRSRGRLFSRVGLGSVACVVIVLLVGASIAADGWLFRIERDLGFGLGVGLMPVMALGILVGIGFLILGLAESRNDASKRAERSRRRISLEDLPPLIGVGRAPIHRH